MLDCGGQSSTEALGVAVVILAMLVLVVVTVQEKNSDAKGITDSSVNSIQCSAISETIANLYNNRATTEVVLNADSNATIQRLAQGPGLVSIGNISCYYLGVVANEQAGVSLVGQKQYKFSKQDGEVNVCEMPC